MHVGIHGYLKDPWYIKAKSREIECAHTQKDTPLFAKCFHNGAVHKALDKVTKNQIRFFKGSICLKLSKEWLCHFLCAICSNFRVT